MLRQIAEWAQVEVFRVTLSKVEGEFFQFSNLVKSLTGPELDRAGHHRSFLHFTIGETMKTFP